MSLAGILVVCALLTQPARLLSLVQPLPVTQESAPPQGESPATPDKDEPQQTPPTGAPSEPPQPATPAPAAESQTSPAAAPEPAAQPQTPSGKPAEKLPPSGKKPAHKKKPASAPTKRVVRNGSTPDPTVQLAPGMTQKQASSELQNTTQLLAATDATLKQISGRQLNPSQQNMVSQIRKYMEQSKQAADQGDPERAHNLAVKAHLLSDDLVKH